MRRLFAAAAVAPLCFAASQAFAQTTVSTATTTPLVTSAAGNITVSAAGSIILNSGTPVTIDSNNTLTSDGAVILRNAPGTAILVDVPAGGRTSTITLNGVVGADDTSVSTDADNDGDIDGPFVTPGTLRYGVRLSGPGVFTGNITQGTASTLGVKGDGGSAGILIESGFTGNLDLRGQTVVQGDNSYGLRVTGPLTGDILALGLIETRGGGATAVSVEGPVTGQFKIGGNVVSTGFRYRPRPATAALRALLDADDLRLGGSTVQIRSSLTKGFLLYAPPPNLSATDTDEDDDGIEDAVQTTAGSVSQFGSAPAVLIGGPSAITLGNVGTGAYGGFGVALRGNVSAEGLYDGISATAVQIGGLGGTVNTSGGVNVRGAVVANAFLADSTAIRFGAGAQVPVFLVEGQVLASSLGDATVVPNARAVRIDAGANVPTLINAGSISAAVTAPVGSATALLDSSGALTSITNSGTISAQLIGPNATTAPTGQAVALDLRANTAGVSLVQSTTSTATIPIIRGDVLFGTGSGSDTLDLRNGGLLGSVAFGGGADTFTLTNNSSFVGGISKNGGTLAIDISAGLLRMTSTEAVALTTLNLGSTSSLLFTANPAATTPAQLNGRFDVAGTATLQSGSTINLAFLSKLENPTTFTLIQAGSLINQGVKTDLTGQVPFVYSATLATTPTALTVSVSRRTAAELGLGGSRGNAFDIFYENIDTDQDVLNAVLSKADEASFNTLYNQFLPDYSGGIFQSVALGVRGVMQAQSEQARDMTPGEPRSWLQEVSVGISQDSPTEVTYRSNGFGLAGGYEIPLGTDGAAIGLSAAFTSSEIRNQDRSFGSLLAVNSFVVGGYWRDRWAGILLDAGVNAGYAWIDSDREVVNENASLQRTVNRTVSADWSGVVASARFGASYTYEIGPYFFRPDAILDYVYMSESGYTETGGGNAIDLQVDSRSSYEAGLEAGITLGARWGRSFRWGPEIRIAYRTLLAGGISDTTARFVSAPNSPFVLSSIGADESRLIIRAAMRGSGAYSNVALEAGGEIGDLYEAYLARLIIRFLF